MQTHLQRCLVTLGVVVSLSVGAAGQLLAQSADRVPIRVVPLDTSVFQEILDAEPYDMPVLVRHRQDPNALRPSDALQTAPRTMTPGDQVARNLLGVPQRSDIASRRGRLRTIAAAQNRASPMIGDLFGGGTASLTLTRSLGEVIPYANTPNTGTAFNGFVGFTGNGIPVGPFFGGVATANTFPLLTTIGVDTNNDTVQDTFPGLQQYQFVSGVADPNTVLDRGPFTAIINSNKTVVNPNGDTVPVLAAQQDIAIADIPLPGTGGAVGRVKMSENTSPMPRDRVYFNYSYFDNVPLVPAGINVDRFTPGFEKTFMDGLSSIEFRAPFATTLNSNVSTTGITDGDKVEFGNASLIFKSLLYNDERFLFAGGMQLALPTADAVNVNAPDGTTIVKIKNQSVRLMPYVGALFTPDERFFSQAYLQIDVAANGNDVLTNLDNTELQQIGIIQDNTFLYLDWSAGYWTYLSEDPSALISGIAPIFELHMNQSLQHTDVVRAANNFRLGTFSRNLAVLNAVMGATVQMGQASSLTAAYVTPIGSGVDQQFNSEFRLFYNKRFGPQTYQTRAF